jgi:hypothetical protein
MHLQRTWMFLVGSLLAGGLPGYPEAPTRFELHDQTDEFYAESGAISGDCLYVSGGWHALSILRLPSDVVEGSTPKRQKGLSASTSKGAFRSGLEWNDEIDLQRWPLFIQISFHQRTGGRKIHGRKIHQKRVHQRNILLPSMFLPKPLTKFLCQPTGGNGLKKEKR